MLKICPYTGWELEHTFCDWCGGLFYYFKYVDEEQKVLRTKLPRTHSGHCTEMFSFHRRSAKDILWDKVTLNMKNVERQLAARKVRNRFDRFVLKSP